MNAKILTVITLCTIPLLIVSQQCDCDKPIDFCVLTSKIYLKKKLEAITVNNVTKIDTQIVVYIEGLDASSLDNFELFRNDSSFTVDWLPMVHDVVEPTRATPLISNVAFIDAGNNVVAVVISMLFDELNMKLRSSYEFKLSSIYDKRCQRLLPLALPSAMNLTFVCDKIHNADCTDLVKVERQADCNIMRTYRTQIFETFNVKDVDVHISVDVGDVGFKYVTAFYGICEPGTTMKELDGKCVIDLESSEVRRFCLPNKENCSLDSDYDITISPFNEERYGIQLCGVHDRKYERPPIISGKGRVYADLLILPGHKATLSMNSSLDPLLQTLAAYTVVILMAFMFILFLIVYKCAMMQFCCFRKNDFDDYHMDEKSLQVFEDKIIGTGKFGVVLLGQLSPDWHSLAFLDDQQRVAVKSSRFLDKTGKQNFLDEIAGAKLVGRHNRIITFIGTIMQSNTFMYVLEYCQNGNLLDFLCVRRRYMLQLQQQGTNVNNTFLESDDINEDDLVSVQQLYRIASHICAGMCYLSTKGIIHNSLCARHVFVTCDHGAKLSDFGHITAPGAQLSGRSEDMNAWTALEVLEGDSPTVKSDVWSFGVVLWELFTLGGRPYYNVPASDIQCLLQSGFRPQKPENSSIPLYHTMRECWSENSITRPIFQQLNIRLNQLVQTEQQEGHRFVTISTSCDYYIDEQTETSPNFVLPEKDPSHLMSESERLLGFRA